MISATLQLKINRADFPFNQQSRQEPFTNNKIYARSKNLEMPNDCYLHLGEPNLFDK